MGKIFLILVFVASLYGEIIGGVSAVVKGEAITMADVKREMKLSKSDSAQAVNNLIRKKLEEIEIKEKRITADSSEVYEEIKKSAARNNMDVNQFYEAVRNSSGLSSDELKESIKHRILSQKLHASIAYSHVSQPTDDEINEYFELHKKEFNHPNAFDVVIYQANDANRLKKKVNNPMFYAPDIATNEQTLPYDRITPELANILNQTEVGTFSQIMANEQGGYMTFYLKGVQGEGSASVDMVKNEIINKLMDNKREQVLSDYFAKLQQNADIKIIRLP
ncbi:MAG: peptidyl-prolyl cis-trans isomerase [Campylobacterales bacterium]|nr:peptidyl-prolyl cis-trans isomerase [Campylobacterales bacterium]